MLPAAARRRRWEEAARRNDPGLDAMIERAVAELVSVRGEGGRREGGDCVGSLDGMGAGGGGLKGRRGISQGARHDGGRRWQLVREGGRGRRQGRGGAGVDLT